MHEHLFRFFLAIVVAKLAFLAVALGASGWPLWALGAEGALVVALGATGGIMAWRARREAEWDGVLPLRRKA